MIPRRDFITLLGGAAAWPLAVRAQQGNRVRRIGVLVAGDENDPMMKPRVFAFERALSDLGWTNGRNLRMDLRWGGDDTNRTRAFAEELVGLQPDIILASTTVATVALQRETRTIPIVFAAVADPVASEATFAWVHRNRRPGLPRDQSAVMPANLTTLAHFSVSSAMSLRKSAGEPDSTRKPRSSSCAFVF